MADECSGDERHPLVCWFKSIKSRFMLKLGYTDQAVKGKSKARGRNRKSGEEYTPCGNAFPPPPKPVPWPPGSKGGRPQPPAKNLSLHTDPFVGINTVYSLDKKIYDDFVKQKDISFIMFYDPKDERCKETKKHIQKASKLTVKPNHAYAAVDCTKETKLCQELQINTFPSFKLYSKGYDVNTFNPEPRLLARDMKRYIERLWVIKDEGCKPCCVPTPEK